MSSEVKTHPILSPLIDQLSKVTGLGAEQVSEQLRPPPKPEMGDYAFPCFSLAKEKKMPPPKLAQELAEQLNSEGNLQDVCTEIAPAGPFLNFRANPGKYVAGVLADIRAAGENYGTSNEGEGKTIVIDFSAPNIAKPFHIGHLMSTIIGMSLVRIFRALGYKVVGVNHLGDWGVQCGFQFLAWQNADPETREKELEKRGLDFLVELYVGINMPGKRFKEIQKQLKSEDLDEAEKTKLEAEAQALKPQVEKTDTEARALFRKLEDGDEELRKLWERLRTKTLEVLQKSYDRLNVSFESDAGEGFYEPYLKPMVEDLKNRGVLVEDQGAQVIPISEPNAKKKVPPFIVIKSDGATKYETRDMAAAIYRKEHYNFAQNLYVVNVQQSLHFSGLFKALEKAGYEWSKDCQHVSFGIMKIKEDGKIGIMSTRGGSMIPLNEVLNKMVEVVSNIITEKNPNLTGQQKDLVSEAVGVGAIVFWIQSRRRTSNIIFEWEAATAPTGDTGPYLQYTNARICSIIGKVGAKIPENADLSLLKSAEEVALVKYLESYPQVIKDAAERYEPSEIATWLLKLARGFNEFYNKHSVLKSEAALRDARLVLIDTVRKVLVKGLALLGLSAPEEM